MRLVICTLYFPPCPLTPANRVYSWAKYLSRFGIYPVIITRQWPEVFEKGAYLDQVYGEKLIIEKKDGYEVHYLPFPGNLRTRSFLQKNNFIKSLFIKGFTAVEMLFRYRFFSLLPYGNFQSYVLQYLRENKADKLLVSGNPFLLFRIGYLAKKRTGIPWIADYRDGWTTDNYAEQVGILTKPVNMLNRLYEKKWLSNAESFTTVSAFIQKGIERATGAKGHVIYNGFFEEQLPLQKIADAKKISFLYSGVVYEKQNYRTPVKLIKKLAAKYADRIFVELTFLGTSFANPDFQNDPVFSGTEPHVRLLDRVSFDKAKEFHLEADAFLMLSHKGMKGIVSSKIFDYIKYEKPVILFENDKDILEEIITRSNLGVIADNENELEEKIEKLILEKLNTGNIAKEPDREYIYSFTREAQAKKLASIIKAGN